ncbi:MAG: hypothetical protein ABI175_26830 [Polyangiales bacterium]
MKPLALLRSAILLSTVCLAACGSDDKKTVSGGAHFRLNGGAVSGACLDPTLDITISVKGEDGKDKLIPDGSDGSNVSCQYDDTHFSVSVQGNRGYAVQADGTFAAGKNQSTDAKILIVAGSNSYRSPSDKPCVVTFTKKEGGALLGRFVCPQLDYTKDASKSCAVTALAADGFTPESYFQFADCGGF